VHSFGTAMPPRPAVRAKPSGRKSYIFPPAPPPALPPAPPPALMWTPRFVLNCVMFWIAVVPVLTPVIGVFGTFICRLLSLRIDLLNFSKGLLSIFGTVSETWNGLDNAEETKAIVKASAEIPPRINLRIVIPFQAGYLTDCMKHIAIGPIAPAPPRYSAKHTHLASHHMRVAIEKIGEVIV